MNAGWLRPPETDAGRSLLVGLALLFVGLFLAWPPLAFIVPGALFILLTFLPMRGDQ